jgi:hypothetical protein
VQTSKKEANNTFVLPAIRRTLLLIIEGQRQSPQKSKNPKRKSMLGRVTGIIRTELFLVYCKGREYTLYSAGLLCLVSSTPRTNGLSVEQRPTLDEGPSSNFLGTNLD